MTKDRGQDRNKDVPHLQPVPDPEAFDPWQFRQEDTSYDRAKFYTKSRDKDGGQSVQYQVSRSILRDVDELVAEKIVPEYRTRGDFVRDAIYHRLKDISEMKAMGQLRRRVIAEMMVARRMQRHDEFQHLSSALQWTSDVLEEASKVDDWGLVAEIITDTWDDIEFIPEPYKTKTIELLRKYSEETKRH
jgi:hypothetical protein